ncbi:hypothetical protein [Paenibacillus sp. SYP-B4298]|uniref:hypothetical protein n=1 Tax=Paenibacillus sp. SYP-B4298 TaxID=2996034 RepID=UPI0022DDD83F|nr:hypothetical protein [Paenibacillus sp. SYP-B4298]
MGERSRVFLAVVLYSLACGILLSLFSVFTNLGFIRYVFSLGVLLLGIRFFKQYESLGGRIAFVVMSIVFYLLTVLIIVAYLYMAGVNLLPPEMNPALE